MLWVVILLSAIVLFTAGAFYGYVIGHAEGSKDAYAEVEDYQRWRYRP
jgi:hypothetical protein